MIVPRRSDSKLSLYVDHSSGQLFLKIALAGAAKAATYADIHVWSVGGELFDMELTLQKHYITSNRSVAVSSLALRRMRQSILSRILLFVMLAGFDHPSKQWCNKTCSRDSLGGLVSLCGNRRLKNHPLA